MVGTVLITGTSTGIGRATASFFLERGWRVAATQRGSSADPLGMPGVDDRLFRPRLDVNDRESIDGAVAAVVERFGPIDVVVNNAGYGLAGPLEAFDEEQIRHQFETNVFGLMAVTRAVLPSMRRRGTGVVINVSSIGGRIGFPYNSVYHSSKFAVEGLSESMRYELADHGVRIKLIEPGGIRTDFLTRSIRWAMHPDYEPGLSRFRRFTESLSDALPGPESVASVIYRAATDGTSRLRYPAKPGPYLWLRRVLPDALWRSMILRVLRTHATVAGAGTTSRSETETRP